MLGRKLPRNGPPGRKRISGRTQVGGGAPKEMDESGPLEHDHVFGTGSHDSNDRTGTRAASGHEPDLSSRGLSETFAFGAKDCRTRERGAIRTEKRRQFYCQQNVWEQDRTQGNRNRIVCYGGGHGRKWEDMDYGGLGSGGFGMPERLWKFFWN